MVEFSAQNRINTIFFEAVPSADGLFLSKSYPASRSWVKAGGSTPRFDPLQTPRSASRTSAPSGWLR